MPKFSFNKVVGLHTATPHLEIISLRVKTYRYLGRPTIGCYCLVTSSCHLTYPAGEK